MKKKGLGLIGALIILLFAQTLSAKNITVEPGQDIQAAIDRAGINDTVFIKSGVYKTNRHITIQNKKHIKIFGLGKVKIICSDPGSRVIYIEQSYGIYLKNLHLTHKPRAEGCQEGVLYVAHSKEVTVQKCILDGCGVYGIEVQTVNLIAIWECEIKNNSWMGVSIADSTVVELIGNIIHDNEYAGSIGDCGKVTLRNNRIYNNRHINKIQMRLIRD
jgi:parallel beta-helix repeat protein